MYPRGLLTGRRGGEESALDPREVHVLTPPKCEVPGFPSSTSVGCRWDRILSAFVHLVAPTLRLLCRASLVALDCVAFFALHFRSVAQTLRA